MYFKIKYLAFLIVVSGLFFQSCSDTVSDSPDKNAKVQVKLVDFPGEYQEVNVNIIEVLYRIVPEDSDPDTHEDVEWTIFESFTPSDDLVDLTELKGGVSKILAEEVLEPGFLTQIRLVLGDGNEIDVDGETFPLQTPSAQQSGLKIKINTLLEAGYSYNIVLDWDVQKSIVKTGNGKYILKPVIRAALEVNSGIIEGELNKERAGTDPVDYEPVTDKTVYLFKFEDVVTNNEGSLTSTLTNSEGKFRFEGISPDYTYKIVIFDDQFAVLYESAEEIDVTKENTTDVGTITLPN